MSTQKRKIFNHLTGMSRIKAKGHIRKGVNTTKKRGEGDGGNPGVKMGLRTYMMRLTELGMRGGGGGDSCGGYWKEIKRKKRFNVLVQRNPGLQKRVQ